MSYTESTAGEKNRRNFRLPIPYPLFKSALPQKLLKHRSTNIPNDSTILKLGEVNVDNSKNTNNLSFLLDFIRKEVESEERINLTRSSFVAGKLKIHNTSKGSQIKQDEQKCTQYHHFIPRTKIIVRKI